MVSANFGGPSPLAAGPRRANGANCQSRLPRLLRDYRRTLTSPLSSPAGRVTSSRKLHRKRFPSNISLRMRPTTRSLETASNIVWEHGATHLKISGISAHQPFTYYILARHLPQPPVEYRFPTAQSRSGSASALASCLASLQNRQASFKYITSAAACGGIAGTPFRSGGASHD
jgi:hypothetical protein